MTPQEKAQELCNKFSWEKTENGYKMFQTLDETKRCALIAVDELINQVTHSDLGYWDAVKQEIEKL